MVLHGLASGLLLFSGLAGKGNVGSGHTAEGDVLGVSGVVLAAAVADAVEVSGVVLAVVAAAVAAAVVVVAASSPRR